MLASFLRKYLWKEPRLPGVGEVYLAEKEVRKQLGDRCGNFRGGELLTGRRWDPRDW